ncbi:MAG TPA: rhomboid family intramembrane serine protease [Mycobacteriales bacterium]|nr:rhomboid family intramembrane serine protease [Mycobacteriales bacterium]
MRKPPVLTMLFLGTTVLLTCLRDVVPGLVPALRRDPSALLSGQVWRVLSPVLVQADPVGVSITVFTLVAVVGAAVESRYGHRRWLVLYLTGALVGEAAGYAFQPHGTGTSVAGCGLLGGLVVLWLRDGIRPQQVTAVLLLALAALDTVLRDVHGLPMLAGAAVATVLVRAASRPRPEPAPLSLVP